MNRGLHGRPLLLLGLGGAVLLLGHATLSLVFGEAPADGARVHGLAEGATGWRLLKAGDAPGAAQAFTRALDLIPDEPSFHVGLGAAYVKLLREEEAGRVLRRAIELDPNATRAYALLGDLAVRQGDWEEAIKHYRIAVRQDPNDVSLEDRLRTARQNQEAEAGFDRLFTPHFLVKFRGEHDRAFAREVADRLEIIYRDMGQRFGHLSGKTTVVVLYPERRFQETTMSPEWAGGLFDGLLRLSVDGLRRNRSEAERSLRHEYTHVLVFELAGGHAPAWLSEGLAQIFDGRSVPGREMQAAGDPDTTIPLHLLHGSFVGMTREAAQQAYGDSYNATRVLIARHGMARVHALLVALAEQPDFDRTFERVLHERYRDFEATWMGTHGGRRF